MAASASAIQAQQYAIDRHVVPGGGGTSSGGVYSVTGAVGLPDASPLPNTGGEFVLMSGFWNLFLMQTAGAPALTIKFISSTTAQISWPSASPGFNLQVNSDLGTAVWAPPAETVQDNGTEKFITVNSPGGIRFFRLIHP
jgi:hypothetical protein